MARFAWIAAFLVGVALASLAACETMMADDGAGDPLSQYDWVARTIAGKDVIGPPGRVTLSFREGRVSGRAGCNLYSGPVEYGKGAIKIGNLISTKMACAEPGLMQQESAYLNTLEGAQSYAARGDSLTIKTATGAIVYDSAPRQTRPEN